MNHVFLRSTVAAFLVAIVAIPVLCRLASAQESDKIAERFRQFDQNGDGLLTADEVPQSDLFKRLDEDGDNKITLDETRAAVAAGKLKGVTLPEQDPTPRSFESVDQLSDRLGRPHDGDIRQGPKVLKPSDHGVGRLIADVHFSDLEGDPHKLSDFADAPALVVAMTGTGCPLCQKFAPSLAELENRYGAKGVAFVFVNPNESESIEELKRAIQLHRFKGPYVQDTDDQLVRTLGAQTTTEAFVLDAARTLVYRGAVDDQYGFGYSLDAPRKTYLADALDAVLSGRQPEIGATSSPGCELYLEDENAPPPTTDITYHNRISRILQNNCLECHRDGGVAPFSLESYEDVKDYAGMIRNVVGRGLMPPWFAAPHEHEEDGESSVWWANDRSLSESDKSDLLAWIKDGAAAGDPADAPLPRKFPSDWMIGKPDLVLQLPEEIAIKATGRMAYEHVRVKTDFAEDRWVQAVEIQPTSPAAVHHVLVFAAEGGALRGEIDEQTGFFAAYVPGNSHQRYPQGFAKKLPAGASLIFQLHYTPNGRATTDQTRLGLVFADEPPQHIIRNAGIANHRISIPPGADNHEEKAVLNVPADVRALALMPHMHLRGKAFRYDVVFPSGQRQRLLDVPRYDFNWQLEYRLAEPLDIPSGSRVEVTGWFDNSADNPANPDPTETVRWGPQTEDEMLLGYVEYYVPTESVEPVSEPAAESSDQASAFLTKAFERADRNGDGKVTPDEFPRKQLFKRLDENSDGLVTLEEVLSAAPRLRR